MSAPVKSGKPFKKFLCEWRYSGFFHLPPHAQSIWMYHFASENPKGQSWPSIGTLCRALKLARRTIWKHRSKLVEYGWLTQVGVKKSHGRFPVPIFSTMQGSLMANTAHGSSITDSNPRALPMANEVLTDSTLVTESVHGLQSEVDSGSRLTKEKKEEVDSATAFVSDGASGAPDNETSNRMADRMPRKAIPLAQSPQGSLPPIEPITGSKFAPYMDSLENGEKAILALFIPEARRQGLKEAVLLKAWFDIFRDDCGENPSDPCDTDDCDTWGEAYTTWAARSLDDMTKVHRHRNNGYFDPDGNGLVKQGDRCFLWQDVRDGIAELEANAENKGGEYEVLQ